MELPSTSVSKTSIPDSALQLIKCVKCNYYVSRGPVYLAPNGDNICARCSALDLNLRKNQRNVIYEKLAVMSSMIFPCRYKEFGCERKGLFAKLNKHESICDFCKSNCELCISCKWVGPRKQLLKHSEAKHPQQVFQQTCTLEHDITSNSLDHYLMSVFHMVFLLQIKLCAKSKKIYHNVRLFGHPELAFSYSYEVKIQISDVEIKKHGVVSPRIGDEPVDYNGIITDFNDIPNPIGFEATSTITLNALLKPIKCWRCKKNVLKTAYSDNLGLWCAECAPELKPCENSEKGCTFTDIDGKIMQHTQYYCTIEKNFCVFCTENVPSLKEHQNKCPNTVSHLPGEMWRIKSSETEEWQKNHLIVTDIGFLIISHWPCDSNLIIDVYSPLCSRNLSEYSCELRLSHPSTCRSLHRTLDIKYDGWRDFHIKIPLGECNMVIANGYCDIKVDLIKKLTPNIS